MASLDTLSDEALVQRVAQGDEEAFGMLFRRRRPDVYRFARHMTASAAAADDVTQEVFLAVMHAAGRFDAGRASAMAWLTGITRNVVRRRIESERGVAPLDEDVAAHRPGGDDPFGELARSERIARVRRAILSLPLRYREVVVLCDLQELPYAAAAEVLGCALGTVRSRLHRARALLAAKLRERPRDRAGLDVRPRRCFV